MFHVRTLSDRIKGGYNGTHYGTDIRGVPQMRGYPSILSILLRCPKKKKNFNKPSRDLGDPPFSGNLLTFHCLLLVQHDAKMARWSADHLRQASMVCTTPANSPALPGGTPEASFCLNENQMKYTSSTNDYSILYFSIVCIIAQCV